MAFIILCPYALKTPIYCSVSTDPIVAKIIIFVELEKCFLVLFDILDLPLIFLLLLSLNFIYGQLTRRYISVYCKIKAFAMKWQLGTGTLLKPAHWMLKMTYHLFASNNCNCRRGCFCSVLSGKDIVIQNTIFERPETIPRQQVAIGNGVLAFFFIWRDKCLQWCIWILLLFSIIAEVERKRVNCKNQIFYNNLQGF